MLSVEGNKGTAFTSQNGSNVIQIGQREALSIFEGYSVKYSDLTANELGLLTLQSVGNVHKIRWGNLTSMSHMLTARKRGCAGGVEKGQIFFTTEDTDLCPVEYRGKICSDVFWDSCFEQIFGTGMDITDLLATEKGRKMWDMILRKLYFGIGNDLHDLAWFGQHPVIDLANDANWYTKSKITPKEWADYVDQMDACTGLITLVDQLKAKGVDNLNVTITEGTELTSGVWTGNIITFFKKLVASHSPIFQTMIDKMNTGQRPIIMVSKEIFEAYKNYLQVTYPGLIESYLFQTTGMDGRTTTARNILQWDGYLVVYNNEFNEFDRLTGTKTHRACVSYPGVFGLGYDIPSLSGQYSGLGMVIQQSPLLNEDDLIRMKTAFKIGTAILDMDLITYASTTIKPN